MFTILVISLEQSSEGEPQYSLVFRHENYHIWESPAKGFLLGTNDFLHFCKDGTWGCNLAKVDKFKDREKERFIFQINETT